MVLVVLDDCGLSMNRIDSDIRALGRALKQHSTRHGRIALLTSGRVYEQVGSRGVRSRGNLGSPGTVGGPEDVGRRIPATEEMGNLVREIVRGLDHQTCRGELSGGIGNCDQLILLCSSGETMPMRHPFGGSVG